LARDYHVCDGGFLRVHVCSYKPRLAAEVWQRLMEIRIAKKEQNGVIITLCKKLQLVKYKQKYSENIRQHKSLGVGVPAGHATKA
jgi:hypothetical protein